MDKMIFTSLNSIQNLYDQRFNISQNLANISVPGYRRDLGNDAGSAFLYFFGQCHNFVPSGAYILSNVPIIYQLKVKETKIAGN